MNIKPEAILVYTVRIEQEEHLAWDNGPGVFSVCPDQDIIDYLQNSRSGFIRSDNHLNEGGSGYFSFSFLTEHGAEQFMMWFKLKYGGEQAKIQRIHYG